MRRLPVFLGLALFGLALLVNVGDSQDVKKDDKKETGKVKGFLPPGFKDLNISAEQKAKIYSIQSDYKSKVADLEKKIKELKVQETKEVFSVLTKAQQDQYLKSKGIDTPKEKAKEKTEKKDGDKK